MTTQTGTQKAAAQKAAAQKALDDIERIARGARQLMEDEKWLELAGYFDHIEKAAHQGFNHAYETHFRGPDPNEESEEQR